MKEWLRRQVDQLCLEIRGTSFTPTFAKPGNMHFGDQPQEGTAVTVARADHLHGMPPEPDPLDSPTTCFYYQEMMPKSPINQATLKSIGSTLYGDAGVTGIGDDATPSGSFGHITLDCAALAFAGVGIQNLGTSTVLDVTAQIHSFGRTERFAARLRDNLVTAVAVVPASLRVAIGAFRATTSTNLTDITDGAYFFIETNAAGVGTFQCVCRQNGVATTVDTGIGWNNVVGTGVSTYQNFIIIYDGNSVYFAIDDTVYAVIEENVPLASKVAGWSVASFPTNSPSANANKIVIDALVFQGRR